MNREKAIDLLDNLIGMIEDNQESDYDTALKMAIQALSQEPTEKPMCDRNICISNEYNGIGCDECIVNKVGHKPCRVKNELNVELNELKPCDDAISRENAITSINKLYEECEEWRALNDLQYGKNQGLSLAIDVIEDLSPVTPSCDKCAMNGSGSKYCNNCGQKSGKWIQLDYQRGKFECSECHTQGYVDTCMYEPNWKYCPICGCRMVESQESEEI